MAAVQFHIHTDKENVTSAGHKSSGNIQVGKTFLSGTLQSLKTPRRALGSVNQTDRVTGNAPSHLALNPTMGLMPALINKPPLAQFQKPNTTAVQKPKQALGDKGSKLNQRLFPTSSADKENSVGEKSKLQEKLAPVSLPIVQPKAQVLAQIIDPDLLPDVEFMPRPEVPDDTDDDIILKKDRVSTYVDRILSWRPSCLFGIVPESEDEEESERRKRIIEELDSIPLPSDNGIDVFCQKDLHLGLEFEATDLELPSLEDIVVPVVDEQQNTSALDLSLPFLDESLGLSAHLGNLVLKDSLPNSPSY